VSEPSPPSIDALRERAGRLRSEASLRRLSRLLVDDGRAGARELARLCARRARAIARKRTRLGSMLWRRNELHAAGARRVAGVDEVGMGPLAGPVVAAAVVLPDRVEGAEWYDLFDSKKVARPVRERLAALVRRRARALAIGEVWPDEIDRLRIHRAGHEAMRRAVDGLGCRPDHLLVDGRRLPGIDCAQTPIVGGDALDASIAAASIVAKVHRDAIMRELDGRHVGYGFSRHMGYGTPEHLEALQRLGPSPVHRRSFAPVARAARS